MAGTLNTTERERTLQKNDIFNYSLFVLLVFVMLHFYAFFVYKDVLIDLFKVMSVKITIDYRERVLYEFVKKQLEANSSTSDHGGIDLVFAPLEIGDITLQTDAGTEFILERKTIADWAASIKDGRLKEQKLRLLSHAPANRIMYMMEGAPSFGAMVDNNSTMHGLRPAVFIGSWISMVFRDGVHVTLTKDAHETASWIVELAMRLSKDPAKFGGASAGAGTGTGTGAGTGGDGEVMSSLTSADATYLSSLKAKKRKIENITPDVCYRLMLCQIPGVSMKVANAIADAYPSMVQFIKRLDPLPANERLKQLSALPFIGKKKAQTILDNLFVEHKLKPEQEKETT